MFRQRRQGDFGCRKLLEAEGRKPGLKKEFFMAIRFNNVDDLLMKFLGTKIRFIIFPSWMKLLSKRLFMFTV
jgi:hypothetical protein